MILDRDSDVAQADDQVMPNHAAITREVELKLEVDPADISALVEHPLLCDSLGPAIAHVSVYYDTKKYRLRSVGLSLRVRRTGDCFVQTVKGAPGAVVGLFDRAEWEESIDGPEPCLDRAAAVSPEFADPSVRRDIKPLFSTQIERRACTIDHQGSNIEVVIDRGEVVAGKRRLPIAEIELELVRGTPEALFSLARELQRTVPLRLGVATKAERGARLVAGREDRAMKAEPVQLSEEMPASDAFRIIALACLRQFRSNEPLVIQRRDADALHQCRVALRRLRSAFSVFRPVLRGSAYQRFRYELRELASTLGTARNLDVLIRRRGDELSPDSQARLLAERGRAYDIAIDLLNARATSGMMIDLAEWLAIGIEETRPALFGSVTAARPFSALVLARYWKRVKKRGRKLRHLDEDDRHELRIAGKKLRYAAEFFASLYAAGACADRRDAFLHALTRLQDDLGDLNDLATERQLSHDLAKLGIIVPRRSRGRESALRDEHLAAAERDFAELLAVGRYWRGDAMDHDGGDKRRRTQVAD